MRHSIIETAGIINAARSIAPVVAVVGDSARRLGVAAVANSLAQALVKDSRPAALVDCDFSYPGLHERWGRDLGPGLASVLASECLVDDVAELIDVPNGQLLTVTAGNEAGLHAGRFVDMVARTAVHRLTELCEVVVLNAGLLSSPIARDVAALSDTLVLVVGENRTIDPEHRPAMLSGLRQYVTAWIDDPGVDYSPARFEPMPLPNLRRVPAAEEPIRWGRAITPSVDGGESRESDVFGLERRVSEYPEALLRPTAGGSEAVADPVIDRAPPGAVAPAAVQPGAPAARPASPAAAPGAFSAALAEPPPVAPSSAPRLRTPAPAPAAPGPAQPASPAQPVAPPSSSAPRLRTPAPPAPARPAPSEPVRADGPKQPPPPVDPQPVPEPQVAVPSAATPPPQPVAATPAPQPPPEPVAATRAPQPEPAAPEPEPPAPEPEPAAAATEPEPPAPEPEPAVQELEDPAPPDDDDLSELTVDVEGLWGESKDRTKGAGREGPSGLPPEPDEPEERQGRRPGWKRRLRINRSSRYID